jgi:hypothetical protein
VVSISRAARRNGIGTIVLNDRPSGLENSAFSKATVCPSAAPKKSPSGADTAGFSALSQNISSRSERSITGVRSPTVIQILRTTPLP